MTIGNKGFRDKNQKLPKKQQRLKAIKKHNRDKIRQKEFKHTHRSWMDF